MKINNSSMLVVLNTILLIILIEGVAFGVLHKNGIKSPFLFSKQKSIKRSRHSERFQVLDPHLGYARGAQEPEVKSLSSDFTWVDGFVVYEKAPIKLQHPVILALGGSTTDGAEFGHSWPEELSVILKTKGLRGTVINGGTGGYSTNQELLKLIRDGLEFKPDIVISYSGINDRGRYSALPYPMVHEYQRTLLESFAQKSQPKFLPSTITLLQSISSNQDDSPVVHYTLGVKTELTLAQQYRKNIGLMNVISKSNGAQFFAFIQPFAFYKSEHANNPKIIAKGGGYKDDVLALYNEIIKLPHALAYVHDATQALEGHTDVYQEDGVHLQREGDRAVAQYIFSAIQPAIIHTGK